MNSRQPFLQNERQRIYQGKLEGKTLSEIAIELGRSVHVVRKWWRRIRQLGLSGLRDHKPGPHPGETLCRFDERVGQAALRLKRTHPRWGANRVLIALRQDPELKGVVLPRPSRLSTFFKQRCPECVARHVSRPHKPTAPPIAIAVHEVWELDNQEKILLGDGCIATISNVRDPVGAAMIASQAFQTQTAKHWRKLDWTEIRQVLRTGFTEWQTMPDAVLTDNELCLAGAPTDPFPSKLTLWLRGLGIVHHFIRPHCPTDQPHIERNHRTLDGFTLDEESRANLPNLQQALDRERSIYNTCFPSRASDCCGQPPLSVHPELLQPRRFYQPNLEYLLFDVQRVYDHLASLAYERHVSSCGVVSLGRQHYSLGRTHAEKAIRVRCDPIKHEWVFLTLTKDGKQETEQEFARRTIKGIDFQSLSGLEPTPVTLTQPVQLALPFLAP
jgi:transposase-like protein